MCIVRAFEHRSSGRALPRAAEGCLRIIRDLDLTSSTWSLTTGWSMLFLLWSSLNGWPSLGMLAECVRARVAHVPFLDPIITCETNHMRVVFDV